MSLSAKALKLILDFEVGGGQNYYEHKLARPTWPEGESGVTIGVGYDLGYELVSTIRDDWSALGDRAIARLVAWSGVTGRRASSAPRLLYDIVVPWALALEIFQKRTVPKFEQQTRLAFPGCDKLPADAYGALVSLVYNRGTSLSGDRRREMRAIHDDILAWSRAGAPGGAALRALLVEVAGQIQAMKRIWIGHGLDGLLLRRDAEARVVREAAG